MMGRVLAACALLAIPGFAADRDFHEIVQAISREFHANPIRIPFVMGLANTVMFFARPSGASHIDLAVFENLDASRRAGRDLPAMIRNAVGGSWRPFVQVLSHRKGHEESVFVFMRNEGRDCRLLIASIEPSEAAVVQLKVNREALERMLAEPRSSVHWR